MEKRSLKRAIAIVIVLVASGCVTQSFENDNSTPVIQNESTNNEIAMTRISLGLGYLKMGNTTQAKLNLEKAKRFAPNLVQVYTAFAHYYDSVSEPELATASFEKALSLNSEDADTLNNYGVFLCKHEDYAKAEVQFLQAIAVPSYLLVSKSYENLALCQLKAEDYAKSEKYLLKAIQHSPSSATALYQMARLQYIKSDYHQATLFFKRYEKATRRFSAEGLALGFKIYQKQYDNRTAKNYALMMVKMFPASFQAKQYLLNGLDEIEADEIAIKYQSSVKKDVPKKKRVVLLSPNSNKTVLDSTESTKVVKISPKRIEQTVKMNDERVTSNTSDEDVSTRPSQEPESTLSENTENESSGNGNAGKVPVHIVEKGQGLFSISVMYNIHMKALERWNQISRHDVLSIGETIYLAEPKNFTAAQE